MIKRAQNAIVRMGEIIKVKVDMKYKMYLSKFLKRSPTLKKVTYVLTVIAKGILKLLLKRYCYCVGGHNVKALLAELTSDLNWN